MRDGTSKNSGGSITVRTRNFHGVAAMLAVLAAASTLTGCGNEGSSPLDTVRALGGDTSNAPTPGPKSPKPEGTSAGTQAPPPSSPDAGDTRRPRSRTTSPQPSTATSTGGDRATGATAPYVDDPCSMMTIAEAGSLTGLLVTDTEVDSSQGMRTAGMSFCNYRDADDDSLITVMVTTSLKSYTSSEEAAKNTIEDSDGPLALAGVGDAAFTYHDDTANGVVWAKDMVGDKYLCADVYIDRRDKDVPVTVLASIARTMIGRL